MRLVITSFFVLLCAFSVEPAEKARFDNYRVYEILIETDEQLELFKAIENYPDGYSFWDFPGETGKNAELMVPPHKFGEFSDFVEQFELKSRLMISNLQEVIDNEQPRKQSKALDWNGYWTYEEVNEWMDSLVAQFPASVSHIRYGKSYENRDLRGVKINIGGGDKKGVLFEGTMHAREWISTATTTWMVNELLKSTDTATQDLAKSYIWYVFPVTNPDGYAYTWTRDRQWRKTRRPSNAICFGADPNRNFDYHFGEGGTSTNPCSDTYPGSAPFSEPETKNLSDYVKTIPSLAAYFSFHAYGQMLMSPWGWTKDLPASYQNLNEISAKGVEALRAKFNTNYKYGSIANVIYVASGSSIDWAYATQNLNLSYAYEFRDEGRYGFSLPASQIVDNSIEIFASIVAILKEAKARGLA